MCQNDTNGVKIIQKEKTFGVKHNGFCKRLLGHFSLGQNLGNGLSESIILENMVVLNFDFNQVL